MLQEMGDAILLRRLARGACIGIYPDIDHPAAHINMEYLYVVNVIYGNSVHKGSLRFF
jgi:hypothetical protein